MILAELEAKRMLEEASIPVVSVKPVRSIEEATAEAQALGFPVVLKLSTPLQSHKTEIGGVVLNLRTVRELEEAFAKVSGLRDRIDPQGSIILEPMAPAGAELFLGVQKHPGFGLVLSLGLGGIWLELMADVAFRLLPASKADLEEMLSELKTWPKLRNGFRHLPPVAPQPLLALMERVAAFALGQSKLQEMDLNPILAYPDRAVVVDARIVIQ